MAKELADVLNSIADNYKGEILATAKVYNLVDIGLAARDLGNTELQDRFEDVNAVVPIRRVRDGFNVEVDGSGLTDYVQLENGIAIPSYVAIEAGVTGTPYTPRESMILNVKKLF